MKREASVVSDFSCWATMAVFAIGLVVLAVRLKEVQIDGAADYNYENARQSARRIQTAGMRGRILARNGEVLADNRHAVSIVCHPEFFQKRTWEATTGAIAEAIERTGEEIGLSSPLTDRVIRRHVNQALAMPLVVWRDVNDEVLARFSERQYRLPGFSVVETEERIYPYGSLAAHVVGFVGRDFVSSEAGDTRFNFSDRELRGRSGIESYYDSYLRGCPGERQLLVDARGFAIRERTVTEAGRGPDLSLTLDIGIQRAVERQLVGETGACVVIDPRDGSVLAFASAPTYNLMDFVPFLSHELYESLVKNPAKPLLNRASGGVYAPGSTFKPLTALAGLSVGFPADDEYYCSGLFTYGTMKLRCSSRWGHGPVSMRTALAKSCNSYFCNMSVDIGTNTIVRMARQFGLGSRTGIDFGVDSPGVVPDADWKQRVYGERWYPGDLPQMSIGQGMLLATPLQMACVAGALGTGYLVTPHFRVGQAVVRKELKISAADWAVVRDGLRMVVDGGTGRRGGEGVGVSVSGKTGTAEVGVGEKKRKNTWFIAYAPSESPVVAIAMVIENGQSGGGTTAPKVAEVLKAVF